MNEITRSLVVRLGVDLSKRVFQVHGVDRHGQVVVRKSFTPERFFQWCSGLNSGCVVAMEACGGSNHVGRRLRSLGLEPRLIAGHLVTPYRMSGKKGKNDAADAAAICEAAARPQMRFVPIKSCEQQGYLVVHRMREGYKQERTACINRIRGALAEFGLVFPMGPDALRLVLDDVLEDASNELPVTARWAIKQAQQHWRCLDEQMAWCDEQIEQHVRTDPQVRKAMQVKGIGPISASATVATVGDFHQFSAGSQFSAWMGTVPSQHSTGGRAKLGRITKRGNDYLRTLLIQGAKAAVFSAHLRDDRISRWVVGLKERLGWQKAAVALANKNARLLWVAMTRDTPFDPDHVPVRQRPAVMAA